MKFKNRKNFKLAVAQVLSQKNYFADEGTKGQWFTAIMKGEIELTENSTIAFDGLTLSFVSRSKRGGERFVTKDGCGQFCPCKNGISYHKAMFAIAYQYQLLCAVPLIEGQRITETDGPLTVSYIVKNGEKVKVSEKCGNVFIFVKAEERITVPMQSAA